MVIETHSCRLPGKANEIFRAIVNEYNRTGEPITIVTTPIMLEAAKEYFTEYPNIIVTVATNKSIDAPKAKTKRLDCTYHEDGLELNHSVEKMTAIEALYAEQPSEWQHIWNHEPTDEINQNLSVQKF